MAIAIRSYSTLTIVGTQDASATPGNAISVPAGLAVGDYLLIGVFFGQGLGNTVVVVPSGFAQLNSTGTSGNRLLVTFGLAISNSTVLSSVTSGVYLRAGASSTRIVAVAAALTGVSAFSSAGTITSNSSSASSVTFTAPASGDSLLYFVATNESAPSTYPAFTSVGGTMVVQANSSGATGGSQADSQIALMVGGTGATFAVAVANNMSVGLGFTALSSNIPPTAAINYSAAGLAVTVNGSASTDSDGTIASYAWTYGDGGTATGVTPATHTYATAGTYTIGLTVTDNGGATGTASSSVVVSSGASVPHVVGTATSTWNGAAANTLTISKPTGVQDGDYLVAFLRSQSAGATADWTSSGWTRISVAFSASQAGPRLIGIYGLAVPSAAALSATSFTFTFTGTAGRVIGAIAIVRGVNLSTPVVATSTPYGGTSITNGNQITGYADSAGSNSLALGLWGGELVAGNTNAITITPSPVTTVTTVYANDTANDGTTGTTGSRTSIAVLSYPGASTISSVNVVWGTITGNGAEGVVLMGTSSVPTASFTYSITNLVVTVDGSGSTDAGSTISSYAWTFGDGGTATGATPSAHTYTSAGSYTITLTVTDANSQTSVSSSVITISTGAPSTAPVALFGTGNSTSVTSAAQTSLSVTKPANIANGDLMVAHAYSQGTGATVTAPSGWTLAQAYTTRPGGIYVKPVPTASAETATSYTWTFSASGRVLISLFRVTGANLASPIDSTSTEPSEGATLTSYADASLTTSYINSLLLGANFWNNSSNATSTMTPPIGMTAGDQLTSPTTGNTSGTLVAYQALTAAGATGTRTFTYAPSAVNGGGLLVAIRAATANPNAAFSYSTTGSVLSVDGTSSSGNNGATISSYDWNWGDSTTHATTSTATHTYTSRGTYTVTLTVTDNNGLLGTMSKSVTVTDNGQPAVLRDSSGNNYPGVMYYWDGSAKHAFNAVPNHVFAPVTVSQFLSAAHYPWFAAHRGFSYSYPEETLYTYRAATDWNIKAIEISVQYSADGTPWCFHDPTTDRTTGFSGTISSMTDVQIAALNNQAATAPGNPSQPARPTAKLLDILPLYYKTHVIFIEDKTYSHTTAVLNIMDSYGTVSRPASEIFIWKVASGSNKASFFDTAAARGYHRWAYIFDSTMSTEFPALATSGKADMIGMDFNSSDSTLSSAIALCVAAGVMPTGHIISSTTQRDRMLGLGMKGLMMSNKDAVPPWYNIW